MQIIYGNGRFPLHHLHVLQTLLRAAIEIRNRCVILQHAGHYLEIRNTAGERVRERLENENRKRFGVGNLALDRLAFMIRRLVAARFSARGGRRENFSHEIQNRVVADIVECGAEEHRENAFCEDSLAQPFL